MVVPRGRIRTAMLPFSLILAPRLSSWLLGKERSYPNRLGRHYRGERCEGGSGEEAGFS